MVRGLVQTIMTILIVGIFAIAIFSKFWNVLPGIIKIIIIIAIAGKALGLFRRK